jgi:hypothetical protein
VVLFPAERMLDMFRERCSRESQSAIFLLVLARPDLRILRFEPFQEMQLIVNLRPPDLAKKLYSVRFGRRCILQSFITIRTNCAQVFWPFGTAIVNRTF